MKILLASHGHFASGLVSSIGILFSYIPEELEYFDAYVDETKLEDKIDEFMERNKEEVKVLISDVYGGSVCQTMVRYLHEERTFVLTGANLGLLMSLLTTEKEIDRESLNEIMSEAKQWICLIEDENLQSAEEEDIF